MYILYPCFVAHVPPQILSKHIPATIAPIWKRKIDSESLGFELKKQFAQGIAILLQVSHFDRRSDLPPMLCEKNVFF